jgi:hypothetical protein
MGKGHGAAMTRLNYHTLILSVSVFILASLIPVDLSANSLSARVGSFSRIGFGPRGMALGNSANAITLGSMGSYYNPATIAYTETPTFEASMGLLSLDRSLNFVHYTTRIPPAAGFSVSLINAGVSDIDGRNRDGFHTRYLSTSENMFSFGFGLQFSEKIAAGIAIKLYYYRLYDDMSSTSVGLDLGVIYRFNHRLTFAANVKDLNSKYKWNSSVLYDQQGRTTTDRFPVLFQFGGSYLTTDKTLLVSLQGEYSEAYNFILRGGVEAYVTENIILRGGIENLLDQDINKPSLGIGIRYPVKDWLPSFNYSIIFEPHAPSSIHVISIGIEF